MLDFKPFKLAVSKQFEMMKDHPLFRVSLDKDALFSTYINSFPAGTNPVFRERTEHECSCCKQFIRAVGDVVAIIDGKIVSIWDGVVPEQTYNHVSSEMARFVKSHSIDNIFLHTERSAGTDKNYEVVTGNAKVWEHFFVRIPVDRICPGADIGTRLSQSRADHDVLLRSLKELTPEATDTVLELIAQNSLYRGAEHSNTLTAFQKLQAAFTKLEQRQANASEKDVFVWSTLGTVHGAVTRIRNTSIGTLLIDLSDGKLDMEDAVRKYEAVVAPTNYKRPTALVTKSMVEAAKKKIQELDLTSALERRYAELSDININDILFADRSARKVIEGDVFDMIATKESVKTKSLDKVESVSIQKFLEDILPKAESLEIMFENSHSGHLVSLIAPVDPGAKQMFKWDNPFSWSYNGDVTDSIKERVKRAGGNVEGDLCCRLSWFNHDDLDLHMIEPDKNHIYYGRKISHSTSGQLDVDMNAGNCTMSPVENIYYGNRRKMLEGTYRLYVNQFNPRHSDNIGFEVEIDYLGEMWSFAYDKRQSHSENVTVAEFNYTHAGGLKIINSLPASRTSKELWGLKTQEFQRVNVVMRSPNYWGDKPTGNEHYFFMIDGCINDGKARGFYNEFLKEELTPHRKVIEIVGSKMKTDESINQLSGVGFSSTQKNEVLVRVKGAFTRVLKIVF